MEVRRPDLVSGTSDYNLHTQKTDGSAPAMIGQGAGLGFSFDGKWATAVDPLNLQHLRVIPTGVGESRTLSAPSGTQYIGAAWMPDGKHILALALAPGHTPNNYLQEVETGAAQQIKSEGKYLLVSQGGLGAVSPDGKYFLAVDNEKRYWVQPIDGGAASEIKGLSPGDIPAEWHGDSENISSNGPSEPTPVRSIT